MKRRDKRHMRSVMALMTVFTAVFITTYAFMGIKSDNGAALPAAEHADTLYRRLSAAPASADSDGSGALEASAGNEAERLPEGEKADIEIPDAPSALPHPVQETVNTLPEIEAVRVQNAGTGEIFEQSLEEYVACAVLAEMPASAPPEALKAQAVACRTLAVRFILDSDKASHNGADICTSSAHCQGYRDMAQFVSFYGEQAQSSVEKIKNAVSDTSGIILLYGGEPIVAAFHASSGSRTASSKEVWGGEVDYLVSVETNEAEREQLRAQVVESTAFSRAEFIGLMKYAGMTGLEAYSERPFSEWISGITRTESGRVDFVEIGTERVSGDFLRRALGLRSCDFSFSYSDGAITFTTVGYGHGVGMSQLGAVSMAMDGKSFEQILSYYYPGCRAGIV